MYCNKISYPTNVDAIVALNELKNRKGRYERRFYLCPHCKKYHLTSRPFYQKIPLSKGNIGN